MNKSLLKQISFLFLFSVTTGINAQITPTNYALQSNWAAGKMKGAFDLSLNGSFTVISADTMTKTVITVPYDSTTDYDIFYVYPTLLIDTSHTANVQAINIASKAAADLTIEWEVSQFTQFGRVYAPYYRQGNLATFFATTSFHTQAAIFDTAVTDVMAAFIYYMQHYNNGKKVIIVAHSQGSIVTGMMIRQFETNALYTPYLKKIFLSVLMGMESGPYVFVSEVTGGWWQNTPICENPTDTACIMSWGTHKYGQPLQSLVNLVPFNDTLVTHGDMYKTFDSSGQHVFMDPLGFTASQKVINYSTYPTTLFSSNTGTNFGVSTNFIGYTNMYYGSISNPNNSNYGFMVDRIASVPGDKRPDPLASVGNDLHVYDAYVGIGDVICLIYEKMGLSCSYNPAGIPEVINKNNFQVYPDPNMGQFTVSGLIAGQTVELYNYMGQRLNSSVVKNSVISLDISNNANGIYLLRIINKDGSIVGEKKVVKTE